MARVTDPGYHQGRTPANKGKRYPAEILTPDEVKTLIRACSTTSSTGLRNRALLTVLYRGGCGRLRRWLSNPRTSTFARERLPFSTAKATGDEPSVSIRAPRA